MNKSRGFTPLAAVLIISGSLALTGCNDQEPQQSAPPAPEVGVVTVKSEPLQITNQLPGRTAAFRIAEVRPQVSGIILKRNFTEGSDIKAGISLYQIDPAPYKAAFDSANGDLAKAQANANIAKLTVKRYQKLVGTQYISQQEYDEALAQSQQANAAVIAAKAALETARINLAYTKVTSPIEGRAGMSTVTEGALVASGQANALVTVQQLDPIYVDVTQSSNEFLRLKQQLADGKLKQEDGKAKVKLFTNDGETYKQEGSLEFSEATVDPSTGSITLRAVFPNPDKSLLPGMFVRAELEEGIDPQAILVPQQGITRTPRGEASALLVTKDNKVEQRTLTTGAAYGNKWLVTKGLEPGDRVIVSGLQRVKPGGEAKPQEVDPDAKNDDQQKQQ